MIEDNNEQDQQTATPVVTTDPTPQVETIEPPVPQDPVTDPVPTPKKVFTREDIKTSVDVVLAMPRLYPDYEPWAFKLKLKLSSKAEEARQDFLSLSAIKQTEGSDAYNLDEIADLLIELPTGFGDLKSDGVGPGSSFKTYVQTCQDPSVKELLYKIVEGVDRVYWNTILPVEFRKSV